MQLSLLGTGGGGAGRIGCRLAALDTALERRAADFGGGDGISAELKASIASDGGASIGAPGKSTVLVGVGSLAIMALAFSEVNFSVARVGLAWASKKPLEPSGMVLGEQGGESRTFLGPALLCPPVVSWTCAKAKYGELCSGAKSDLVGGLAGSYSCVSGGGISTRGQAGWAGSYSRASLTGTGGLEGNSTLSEELCSAKGEELCSS